MLKNDLLLRAARGQEVERAPVWLMRQAGRPVDILGVDAAIIFSDILVIPEAMGLPYQMIEAWGPWFEHTVKNKGDVDRLSIAEVDDLRYVMKALQLAKKGLGDRVPLIGFAGAPWTLFAYMIEGSGSKTFSAAKQFLYAQPQVAHQLLEKITQSTINYLKGQVASGADLLQIFDSWAGVL
ncbi:hypothetical protein Egran_07131, partial [Elaphomyces granulatus]